MERCFHLSGPDVRVYLRFDAPDAPDAPERITPGEAAAQVRDWLARRPHVMIEAHDAVVARDSHVLRGTRDERREWLERGLEVAFSRGELVAFRVPLVFPVRKVERPLELLGPQALVKEVPPDTTWIALELHDDGNPAAPVPYAQYEIELADGTLQLGSLDAEGRARIDGIVRGPTKVRFPELDGHAWSQA